MNVIMFAGQGSQAKGVGGALFSKYSQYVRSARDILGYSVEDLFLGADVGRLDSTDFAQPAIFLLNHLYYLEHCKSHPSPDIAIGHSLGEYNALVCANVISFEEGLRMVQMRGILMRDMEGGTMSAVVGPAANEIEEAIRQAGLADVEIGNFNTPRQHVLTGTVSGIDALERVLAPQAKLFRLKVSGPFHSRFMRPASAYYQTFLERFAFRSPTLTVYSNAHVSEYSVKNALSNLVDQIWMPVRWADTMRRILPSVTSLDELGHSRILSNMRRDFE